MECPNDGRQTDAKSEILKQSPLLFYCRHNYNFIIITEFSTAIT